MSIPSSIKLHVGCGKKYKHGYMHQDIVQYRHIDFVSPCWICPALSETFDEVYSRHLLEHLYPNDAKKTIKEWHRILKPSGMLILVIPDLAYHVKQFFMDGKSKFVKATNREHAMAGLYGWLDKGNIEGMAHKWGYTKETLSQLIVDVFGNATIINISECELKAQAIK